MGQIDLHIHTTASDGCHTPREVVEMAADLGLWTIAITDHDSTEGVAEAERAARSLPLEVIHGVEINADFARSELHILGYYLDCEFPELQDALLKLRTARRQRAARMIDRLAALGLPLERERVAEIAGEGSAIGRPHVAQAMVERGYVDSVEEAFARYIGRGGPAHVERFKLSPLEALRLIRQAGGLPVLAHPLQLMDLVPELAAEGLAGLEAYYTGYTEAETRLLLDLARKHNLLVTGGSDFHGAGVVPEARLGGVEVPLGVVERLRRAAR